MTFSSVWTFFWCAAGLGAGVYWFFQGLRGYRAFRFLADTPQSAIRSLAMGLVHIHGKALGGKVMYSPVTRRPCLYYEVEIERWNDETEESSGWRHYLTDSNGVEFYLQDRSGRVRVDPHGARLDLPWAVRCRTGRVATPGALFDLVRNWRSLSSRRAIPALDEDLRAYVGSLAPPSGGDYRFTEHCILQGSWYDVIGTCVENPNARDERERNMIVKGENDLTFLISFRSERELETNLRTRALRYVFAGAGLCVLCLGILLKVLR